MYQAVADLGSAAVAAWTLYPFLVASLIFMSVTQVSHLQARAQAPPRAGQHWAAQMVATSVDYGQDSHLATFLTGGLNMQGLHHCVPTLSSSRFFLANKHARTFLFFYVLLMHALVFATLLHFTRVSHGPCVHDHGEPRGVYVPQRLIPPALRTNAAPPM